MLIQRRKRLKLIALEEHYLPAEVRTAWDQLPPALKDPTLTVFNDEETSRRLEDFGATRLQHMDEMGVDMQVISLTTPATQNLEGEEAVRLARLSNNRAAKAVAAYPDRLQAFATLPTPRPEAAVRELERCVNDLGMKGAMLTGRTRNQSLDAPEFFGVFEAAARLKVPLYLHPQIPVQEVRSAYYTGFGEKIDTILASGGWGWHAETGIQAIRLILSGIFDRLPELQIILGHWGEVMIFFLERIGPALDKGLQGKLSRRFEDYIKSNFYLTPSGILSERYLRNAMEVVGIDRIMFAIDYPFVSVPNGRQFLAESGLPAVDQEKIAHGNWECLTAR